MPPDSLPSAAAQWRKRRHRLTVLESTINAQDRDERQRAVCALLRQPLLQPDGPTREAFTLVQKHREWLRPWFAHHLGWPLSIDADAIRLTKRPARLDDATRPCREPNSGVPLSRRAYVILCLALGALVRSDRQTTFVRLRDAVLGAMRAEPRYEAVGLRVEMEHLESRRDFVHAVRLLLTWGVLKRVQGDLESLLRDAGSDALYNVQRPVLARLLASHRPPSLVGAATLPERLRAMVEDDATTSEETRHRRLRTRLFRQLIDDPVLYYDALSEEEREYLGRQRPSILREIQDATGLVPEVRAEGIAMVDTTDALTDYGLPEEGTDGHLTLLLATFLAGRLRHNPQATVTVDALVAQTRRFIVTHHAHWRKNVRDPGQDRLLTRTVVERLCALGLARLDGETLVPLPAVGRFAMVDDEERRTPAEARWW